jgi:hypothetical protein
MNANELANELEKDYHWIQDELARKWTVDMLRQQQAEIEDLKSANRFIQNFAEEQHQRAVALEMRELTDNEIEEVWIQALQDEPKVNAGKFPSLANQPFVFFAKAILRKAQEK